MPIGAIAGAIPGLIGALGDLFSGPSPEEIAATRAANMSARQGQFGMGMAQAQAQPYFKYAEPAMGGMFSQLQNLLATGGGASGQLGAQYANQLLGPGASTQFQAPSPVNIQQGQVPAWMEQYAGRTEDQVLGEYLQSRGWTPEYWQSLQKTPMAGHLTSQLDQWRAGKGY